MLTETAMSPRARAFAFVLAIAALIGVAAYLFQPHDVIITRGLE